MNAKGPPDFLLPKVDDFATAYASFVFAARKAERIASILSGATAPIEETISISALNGSSVSLMMRLFSSVITFIWHTCTWSLPFVASSTAKPA